jgi:aldehyde:ferredoxin oxidoreductase
VEASKKYGGEDFALALGGNEIAGYHCGYATILGQLFGGRHSHLDNAGYSLDQKIRSNPLIPEEMVDKLISEEQGRCVFNSLVTCLFARGLYSEKIILDALEVVDIKRTFSELDELGELIYKERFKFKTREGFNLDELAVPKRFFQTKSLNGMLSEDKLSELADLYRNRIKEIL